MSPTDAIAAMRGVTKSFSGVQVLRDGQIEIRPGEIHALMGANGAGKSTLMKILVGVYHRDGGEVLLADDAGVLKPATYADPKAAHDHGIAIVHQELILMDSMTISQNVSLGREPMTGRFMINDSAARQFAAAALHRVGLDLDPKRTVGSLSPAQKQLVEIARAIASNARVLILDEPTTSLSAAETAYLLGVLRTLRDEGLAIVYISHRMDEIFALTDTITVMRDGGFVDTVRTSAVDRQSLVRLMIGRDLAVFSQELTDRTEAEAANLAFDSVKPALQVTDLRNAKLRDVSLVVRPGEIVGLFGLVGAGRTELARAIFGVDSYDSGSVDVNGEALRPGSPRAATEAGIGFAPEDRKTCGLVLELPIIRNIELAALRKLNVLRRPKAADNELWVKYQQELGILARGPEQVTRTLSGGNQQKVVLAKWLAVDPKILILDEPTKGIDVGAKQDIYSLIRVLADRGMAVLVISSESEEIQMLSDRVVVMREGSVTYDGVNHGLDDEALLQHAMGVAK